MKWEEIHRRRQLVEKLKEINGTRDGRCRECGVFLKPDEKWLCKVCDDEEARGQNPKWEWYE